MIEMTTHPTNKAQIVEDEEKEMLFSYGTLIMVKKDGKFYRCWDDWSSTTGRHIGQFCGMNKKQFMELPFWEEK